ncbi:conserved hypothetical protein [Methanocaldococcus vulcanius M7]|uniref:Dehydrogenase (Flavoprotein)-like protein n=1 Tax=Methanocaldococcus vulcanius (strain ATCC 700851 / DSM 12094 / M7) TaxID=579137 RepID=C9RDI8_METVM|nr:NAD(P)/FAD-dependent oxidoreductase [Methanocaldococcus vulcanius]ACX73367.1 conserved hypothetical protein [Methanocaldococcus vulcanius M7]
MRVGIIGAGLSGSIFYNLMSSNGFNIDIYDPSLARGCKSVNFIFSDKKDFLIVKKVLKIANLDIKDYIVNEIKKVNVDGDDYSISKKVFVLNKLKLIEDLTPRTTIINREFNPVLKRFMTKVIDSGAVVKEFTTDAETKFYDLIVDASGCAKVLQMSNESQKHKNDIRTCQFLISCNDKDGVDKFFIDEIKIQKGKPMIGYTWVNPIGDNLYHVGCAYYKNDYELWNYLAKYSKNFFGGKCNRVCSCTSKINGNLISESFIGGVYEKRCLVGIGESIGLTSPVGQGNVYAVYSAYILSKLLKKYDVDEAIIKYKNHIIKNFSELDTYKKSVKNFNILGISKFLKTLYNVPTTKFMKILIKSKF